MRTYEVELVGTWKRPTFFVDFYTFRAAILRKFRHAGARLKITYTDRDGYYIYGGKFTLNMDIKAKNKDDAIEQAEAFMRRRLREVPMCHRPRVEVTR